MKNFKLDLSKLTPVAEKDRVKGDWYVVADNMSQYGRIEQWSHEDRAISFHDGDTGTDWYHWFAIPPNLPGFPNAELPDEFEIKGGEWEFKSGCSDTFTANIISGVYRRKPKPQLVPTLVIPAGTIEERKKRLQEELDKLDSL